MHCQSCGGVLGRDCFNPQECAEITADMAREQSVTQSRQMDDLREALKLCLPYVARYESEHMSNDALDAYSAGTAALAQSAQQP